MEQPFIYLLFIKIYRAELQQFASNYIETKQVPEVQKRNLHLLTTSFINFLATQKSFKSESLHYWVQVHRNSVSLHDETFLEAITCSLHEMLTLTEHSARQEILNMHEELVQQSKIIFEKWHNEPLQEALSEKFLQQLDLFTVELVKHNGSEDLTVLLKHLERLFGFKRCLFFSYNPWLEEFSGVIGAEPEKVERMRGKISVEPVFAMKQPIFLKNPAPYVQQIAIDLFNLSSIIFIPVMHEHQLYGWLTFDQIGESFDCSQEQLIACTKIGERLGLYLGRKQLRYTLNRQISLSEKELMILYLLMEGYSNKEMATFMFISEFTVRDYIKLLMQKLNARNRTHLIALAFRSGIVD